MIYRRMKCQEEEKKKEKNKLVSKCCLFFVPLARLRAFCRKQEHVQQLNFSAFVIELEMNGRRARRFNLRQFDPPKFRSLFQCRHLYNVRLALLDYMKRFALVVLGASDERH